MAGDAAGPSVKPREAASARPQSETCLSGDHLFFADKQFDDARIAVLTANAQALGASITTVRNEATAILVNPSSEFYREEELAHRASDPPLIPYHWIACCRYAEKRLELSELPHTKPVLTHPDRSAGNQPLCAWVSVNIHRRGEADAYEAQKAVIKTIEQGGGVTVTKRALADMLVVDFTSKFYQTVLAEHKKAGRDHQRFVERDWVETCVQQERMKWPARDVDENAEDSMAEEDPAPARGKGPGRPTGKPRIDYTPEDDDFLCRYLAAYHPSGSWHSRKTYDNLVNSTAIYPIAARHSSQSWHEHFKKGSAILSKRVARFYQQDVDHSLKTREERKKAKELKEAQEAKEKEQAAAVGGADLGQPLNGDHQTAAQREGARLTEMASQVAEPVVVQVVAETNPVEATPDVSAVQPSQTTAAKKSVLVELDSDDEQASTAKNADTRTAPPVAKDSVPTLAAPREEAVPVTLPDGHSLADDSAASTRGQALDGLGPEEPVNAAIETGRVTAAVPQLIEGDSVMAEVAPDMLNVAATSAAEVNVEPEAVVTSTQTQVETRVEVAKVTVTSAQPLLVPAQPVSPVKAHPSILASPRSDGRSPKKVRLDLEPSIDSVIHSPRPWHSEPAVPNSNALGRDIREITRPRHSVPSAQPAFPQRTPDRTIQAHPGSSPLATPLRRSLVHDNIMSSERKRRRSMDKHSRASATPSSAHQPDVVLASTTFPPARVQVEPLPPPPPYNGPYLSESERTEQILSGQRLIQQKKDEYKQNIQKFCDKYGLTPGELMAVVNELPKRRHAVGAVYWVDVEMGLRERFGR